MKNIKADELNAEQLDKVGGGIIFGRPAIQPVDKNELTKDVSFLDKMKQPLSGTENQPKVKAVSAIRKFGGTENE